MLKFLVALRNVLVVVILGWLGFSEKPNEKETPVDNSTGLSLLQNVR